MDDTMMTDVKWVIGILVGIAVIIGVTKLAIFCVDWKEQLEYINMELERSEGNERKFWEHEKRMHYRRIFPFLPKK